MSRPDKILLPYNHVIRTKLRAAICQCHYLPSGHTSRYSRQPYANQFDQPFGLVVTIILPPTLGNVHKLQHVMQRFQVITS